MHFPQKDFKNSGVPGPLPGAVRSEIPGIEKSTLFWQADPMKVATFRTAPQSVFRKQDNIIYADNQYFSFFDYQWLAGSPKGSLNEPNQVVLTESRARTYFKETTSIRKLEKRSFTMTRSRQRSREL